MKLSVEIDMATLGFEQDPETGDMYPTSDLVGAVARILADRVSGYDIKRAVEEKARELADERVSGIIAEVLSGPIQRTDRYGNSQGAPTTVREMVMDTVDKWMTLPRGDSYSRSQTMGDTLHKIVDEILRAEMKGTIDAAKKKIHGEVLRLAVDGAASALASARVI